MTRRTTGRRGSPARSFWLFRCLPVLTWLVLRSPADKKKPVAAVGAGSGTYCAAAASSVQLSARRGIVAIPSGYRMCHSVARWRFWRGARSHAWFFADVDMLGPPEFEVMRKSFERMDMTLKNKRGLQLECSWYRQTQPQQPTPCIVYLHGNSGCRCDADDALLTMLPYGVSGERVWFSCVVF
jgi:hypothetical protein